MGPNSSCNQSQCNQNGINIQAVAEHDEVLATPLSCAAASLKAHGLMFHPVFIQELAEFKIIVSF